MLFIYTLFLKIGFALLPLFVRKGSKMHRWLQGQKSWKSSIANFAKRGKTIWFHCASVGEFEQARPVIEQLNRSEKVQVVLTFFSPSGYELRKDYELADLVCYLPFDLPSNVKLFLNSIQPDVAVFVKYELWFNYLSELNTRGIPTTLISAHFPEKHWTLSWPGTLLGKRIQMIDQIFVQNETTSTRLQAIGVTKSCVSGDTRFDRVVDIANEPFHHPQLDRFAKDAQVLVIGSNWSADDAMILDVLQRKEVKLIVAPHEMSESQQKTWENAFGDGMMLLSEMEEKDAVPSQVVYVNRIGLLSKLYRYASVAYIGGGFGEAVHNTLEAAVYGIPVVFGPQNQRFQEIQDLKDLMVGLEVHNTQQFEEALTKSLSDEDFYKRTAETLKPYFNQSEGASKMVVDWIKTQV